MNLRDHVLEETVLTLLAKKIGDALKGHRAITQTALEEEDIDRQGVRLPNGTKVATITVTDPAPTPAVTDYTALMKFVTEHAPGEIVEHTVREIRPAYLTALMEQMTDRSAAEVVTEAGEIVEVPGVEIKTATRTHSVRFTNGDASQDAVTAALAAGELSHLSGVRALMPGSAK